ncbi:MAG: type IV pilus twitching motility protein PilT [Dehalococcoidales bacterium]|nr:type IV pilus twitching motility protein PilT [Dehalococcoidales bacterium]
MHINDLLRMTTARGASDLHLKVGGLPVLRINGELIAQEDMGLITGEIMQTLLNEVTTDEQRKAFADEPEADFAYQADGIGRFRINACLQDGAIGLACRPVSAQNPTMEELGLPAVCKDLALKTSGLVVVTGPTGCGKSTTLAAMMNYTNQTVKRKVVTIEDPIEFVHRDNKCFFSQRELGRDTKSFASALKHVLRQDPDVILVGEMRDLETMAAVLTAAETGHLVLTTLHTPGTPEAIDRFIDVFPPYQQQQVRIQLSITLEGVLYQVLVPKSDGSGRVAAVEVMLATPAIRNLIREGKTHQMMNSIQTGAQYGMQTLNQSLASLYNRGVITKEDALARSTDTEELNEISIGH